MWSTFALGVALGALFLYLPGCMALRGLGMPLVASVGCAPFLALLAYGALAMGLELVGIPASWGSLFAPVVGLSVAITGGAWLWRRRCGHRGRAGAGVALGHPQPKVDWAAVALYLVVGMALGCAVFLGSLGSPDASVQEYDNVHHLGSIRGFLETGRWSSLSVSLYPTEADGAFAPWPSASFYPSAWHCLAAMMAEAAKAEVAVALNASLFLLSFVVFPLSMLMLLRMLFPSRPLVALLGSCCVLVLPSFPWAFLTFGPLYPNLASYAAMPAVAACFLGAFAPDVPRLGRIAWAALFALGLASLALLQPNAVFSVGVLLLPFCIMRSAQAERFLRVPDRWRPWARVALGVAFAAVALGLWTALYMAPFMQGVVTHAWGSFTGLFQALANVALLAFPRSPALPLSAALVALGAAWTLWHRRYLWLSASYLVVCLMYVVCARVDGPLRFFLTGFWYTDVYRITAMAAVFAVPLLALGLYSAARGLGRLMEAASRLTGGSGPSGRWPPLVAGAAFLALACFPSFNVTGYGQVTTATGEVTGLLRRAYVEPTSQSYDEGEQAFVEEAMALLPEGAVVANDPNDGSAFAYGLDGLNVMYRYLSGYGGSGESSASRAIRERLDDVGTDEEVREALRQTGVRYVLLLDQGPDQASQPHLWTYRPEQWPGLNGIDDGTPGFEKVLSRGDMRLYRVTALDEEG